VLTNVSMRRRAPSFLGPTQHSTHVPIQRVSWTRFSGSWAHPGTRTGFRSPKKTAKFYFGTRPRPTGKSRPPKREGRRGRGKQEELAGLGFPPPPPRCRSRCWWSAPRASRSLGLTGRSTSRSVTSSTTTPCEPPFLPFFVD
jgi:hypothetical protein